MKSRHHPCRGRGPWPRRIPPGSLGKRADPDDDTTSPPKGLPSSYSKPRALPPSARVMAKLRLEDVYENEMKVSRQGSERRTPFGAGGSANPAAVEDHVGACRRRVKRAGRWEERGDRANTCALFRINPLNPPKSPLVFHRRSDFQQGCGARHLCALHLPFETPNTFP
jgi:hypothetical protein